MEQGMKEQEPMERVMMDRGAMKQGPKERVMKEQQPMEQGPEERRRENPTGCDRRPMERGAENPAGCGWKPEEHGPETSAGCDRKPEERTLPGNTVVAGVVVHGRHLGRELGFPTANLGVPEGFPLEDGVYRSRIGIDGRWYDGMSNLGCNPSVGGSERRLETHIFDFAGDLYGRMLRVELLEKIRDEQRFASVEELREQIARDRATVLRHVAGTNSGASADD